MTPSLSTAGIPPSYPMPAYLNFTPGGMTYGSSSEQQQEDSYNLAAYSQAPTAPAGAPSTPRSSRRGVQSPDSLIHKAKLADDRLRQYALFYGGKDPNSTLPYFLPSLSVMANAAFGRLTGVPPAAAKTWADAMVLQYLDEGSDNNHGIPPATEEEILNVKPAAMRTLNDTTVNVLRRLLQEGEAVANNDVNSPTYRPRPCGYVFKRGDIAWNCRTCQTDSTCVICDACFRDSKHDGHEVYFHRTTPGGCCDCGDAEAWRLEGCCDAHRPQMDGTVEIPTGDDPEEAVRMAERGRKDGIETLTNSPTALPPKLAASLGVVIGAAVNCLVQAVDGAGIGADPSQWKLRWTDEASKIWNGVVRNEDYTLQKASVTPHAFLASPVPQSFPTNYRLHLRLHNDDVHTFDEVIDALHEPRHARRNTANNGDDQDHSLVTLREAANEMTHHVDADGQVSVKTYSTIAAALQGFRRLKSRGLHCALVSTSQVDLEQRARALSSWLADISAAHPAAAVLVVNALVQVGTSQEDLAGVSVWHEPRIIPTWAATGQPGDAIQTCRRRFHAFPPHLASSYLTSDEAERLHEMCLQTNAAGFVELTGKFKGNRSSLFS